MKPRTLLAMFIIPLGLIIAAVPQNKTKQYKLTADQLLAEVNTKTQYVAADVVADMIVKKDPSLRLIDVRSQEEFEKFSLCQGQLISLLLTSFRIITMMC